MTDDTLRPGAATDNPASQEQRFPPKSLLDVPEAHGAPMTREDVKAYVRMSFADKLEREFPIEQVLAELPAQPPGQVVIIVDRIGRHTSIPVRLPVILLVSTFCSTPALCVLWAYTIVVLTRTLGRAVQVGDLADAFPKGFPTKEGAGLIWDAQKEARGNRLDFAESWRAPTVGGAA